MKNNELVKLNAFWDQTMVPASKPAERGLMLEITATEAANLNGDKKQNKPLNLALVLDASGSMCKERLTAAKEAATGLCMQLGPQDRLSVISFASDVRVHISGLVQDEHGRRQAIAEINAIKCGGSTNLSAGWIEGTDQVAKVMDCTEMDTGHVVILSDGYANEGITDTGLLSEYSQKLAERGVTTSAVGIGNDYSPRQLDALAEAGKGRLHDAETPEEIVEVVLGELWDVRQTICKEVEVELRHGENCGLEVITSTPHEQKGNLLVCNLQTLRSGSKRNLFLLVNTTAVEAGYRHDIQYRVKWVDVVTGVQYKTDWYSTSLEVVDPSFYNAHKKERDYVVAEKFAWRWVTGIAYEAMRLNESSNFDAANALIDFNYIRVSTFVEGLSNKKKLLSTLKQTQKKVIRPWKGRSKQEAYVATKKVLKDETEHRSTKDLYWQDKL